MKTMRFENIKIHVSNLTEHHAVLNKLVKLGFKNPGINKNDFDEGNHYLYTFEDKTIRHGNDMSYFLTHPCMEATVEEILSEDYEETYQIF